MTDYDDDCEMSLLDDVEIGRVREDDDDAVKDSDCDLPEILLGDEAQQGASAYATPCSFLTGLAGSGKSFEIRRRLEEDSNYAVLSSSTGISAVNLNATTIHSLLGFFDTNSLKDAYLQGSAQRKLRRILDEGYRNVVIDECSMISKDVLDLLVRVFDDVNEGRPAGAAPIGLVVVGDLCLAKGTLVTKYDGSLIKCEDVEVGMQLMGPDFMPRNVTKICAGVDQMYKVTQTNGDAYIVNSKHRLALKRGVDGQRLDQGEHPRYRYMGDEFAMPAAEFATKNEKFRECFVGYKAGLIPMMPVKVSLEAYFLGIWLGDGNHDDVRLTTPDVEVIEYCEQYAKRLNMKLKVSPYKRTPPTPAMRVGITHIKPNMHNPNPIMRSLLEYNLLRNKHIPKEYLYNSVSVRLDLLAGLLDSDGNWSGNRYTFSSVKEDFARSVKQLADQLGFRTGIRTGVSTGLQRETTYWAVSIGGDTWRIPCKIARKKSVKRELGRSRMTSKLKAIPVGVGEYAGFEVDGDHRFLLADGTVTYNCQLPPIPDRPAGAHRARRGSAEKVPWLIDSEHWHRFAANTTRLTKIWRQDDPTFLAALNHARAGEGIAAVSALTAAGARFESAVDVEFDGTTIVGTNEEANRINMLALDRVQGRALALPARRWGKLRSEWKETLIPERTVLKEGAYVTLLANKRDGADWLYVNGDCGHVIGIQPSTDKYTPPTVTVKLVRTGGEVSVGPLVRHLDYRDKPDGFQHEVTIAGAEDVGRYLPKPHYRSREKRYVAGQIEYYPIRLAYASTCHRAQGLTLDRVQIDMRSWQWAKPAMGYVAISRCRSAKELRLIGMKEKIAKAFVCDERVRPWL